MKANGYEVRVFDLLNPDASFCYNPLAYVRDDKDVLRLIETLIQSTTPPGAQSADPFLAEIRNRASAGTGFVPHARSAAGRTELRYGDGNAGRRRGAGGR